MGTTMVVRQVVGPMVTTGMVVAAGDELRVTCVGFIDEGDHNLGRIKVDGDGRAPGGDMVDDGAADSKYPLDGGVRYALVGRIIGGGKDRTFALGRSAHLRAPVSGVLFLGANDDQPDDNTPARGLQNPWTVTVDHIVPDPPAPKASPGLRIHDIQILQVAQSSKRESMLVSGKTTTVRAFITVPRPLPAGTRVNGFVVVHHPQLPGGAKFFALNGTGSPNAVQVALEGDDVDANQTSASLNFEVPGSALPFADGTPFQFDVTVFVNEGQNTSDGFTHFDFRSAGFLLPPAPLVIHYLGIRAPFNGGPTLTPMVADLFTALPGIETRLPVPDGSVQLLAASPAMLTIDVDIGGDGAGYDEMLKRLVMLRVGPFSPVNPDLWSNQTVMGVVAPNPSPPKKGGWTSGIQWGSTVIVGLYSSADETAAHELNHTLGLHHAAAANATCKMPQDIDSTLPTAADAPGWSTIDHTVVEAGRPALMGYCNRRWPTEEEYSRGYRALAGK